MTADGKSPPPSELQPHDSAEASVVADDTGKEAAEAQADQARRKLPARRPRSAVKVQSKPPGPSEWDRLKARVRDMMHESWRLQQEKKALHAEVQKLDSYVRHLPVQVHKAELECERLLVKEKVVKLDAEGIEKSHAQDHANMSAAHVFRTSERDVLREELAQLRGKAAQLEDKDLRFQQQLADAQETLSRGQKEREQLRGELRELHGERTSLASDQELVARIGVEHREQAKSLEVQIGGLARELTLQDTHIKREHGKRQESKQHLGAQHENEHEEWEHTLKGLPQTVDEHKAEADRCQSILEDFKAHLISVQEVHTKLQEERDALEEQRAVLQKHAWHAEGSRDATRAARVAVELEVEAAEKEVQRLTTWIARVEDQNRRMLLSQVPLHNAHSHLVQKELRRTVREHLSAYPPSDPPRSPRAACHTYETHAPDRNGQAHRLRLAGIVSE
eukprot:gnl/TRDRNA2_/TRDRNA2_154003_c1_seq1.p1 gnl/TRDRNA2_/TRDRNA2_154003_c1~~gnl/TRDRNA2_/TRDRNA2_154003_c1_seq1.p1  ORF type:complete len:450 (-),score=112.56 gnl/TRDRNA2_/TRDRNA2_154003_c1_seq1:23-1372(-)